jgi:excisionase family DNA binding protein
MNALTEVDRTPRTVMMHPNNVLYQITEDLLEKLIIKAEEKGFERGQKRTLEKPLTREEAAAFLRVEPITLDRWLKSGKLPHYLKHVVAGSTILFLSSELEEYIKKS